MDPKTGTPQVKPVITLGKLWDSWEVHFVDSPGDLRNYAPFGVTKILCSNMGSPKRQPNTPLPSS